MARDTEVEAMQVKRMFDGRGVDHAEVNRIALRERQAFVVGPRLAVEDERRFEGARLRKVIEPFGDEPDALLRRRWWGARRIDDESARELRIEPESVLVARETR